MNEGRRENKWKKGGESNAEEAGVDDDEGRECEMSLISRRSEEMEEDENETRSEWKNERMNESKI